MNGLEILTSRLEGLSNKMEGLESKTLMNVDQAATYLCMSKSTLYKHTSKGQIAFYKPNGKLILFKKSDLDTWLETKRFPPKESVIKLYGNWQIKTDTI